MSDPMPDKITEQDGRLALRDHVLERAHLARTKHGPEIDYGAILRILDDRTVARYPVGVRFSADGLEPGEFAHAAQLGAHPKDGFCIFVHPSFEARRELWPLLIAYHIPPINYGDIAEPEDCEAFGAALLGLETEAYYAKLCELSDEVS
ncbi:MAG: hypothetical protein ACOYN0_18355 [Phycisphaerales bacterium]